MNYLTHVLVAAAAGASTLTWANAVAQSDAPSEPPEPSSAFEEVTGGHYFGEDEPEEVKRLAPHEQVALLFDDPANLNRARAKGQVAQLRDQLDRTDALTKEQELRLEKIFIIERDHQERDVKRQYATFRITGTGITWYGASLLASDELGIPVGDQFAAQIEEFSQQQIAAVAPVLSARQLEVYREIQRKRVAQHKELRKKLSGDGS